MCNGGQWYTIVSVLVQGHTAVSRFNVCSCIVVRSIEKTFTAFLNAQSNQLRVKSYKVVTRLYFCFFFRLVASKDATLWRKIFCVCCMHSEMNDSVKSVSY